MILLSNQSDLVMKQTESHKLSASLEPNNPNFPALTKITKQIDLPQTQNNFNTTMTENYLKFPMQKNTNYLFKSNCKIPFFFNYHVNQIQNPLEILERNKIQINYNQIGNSSLKHLVINKNITISDINLEVGAISLQEQEINVLDEGDDIGGIIYCLNIEENPNYYFYLEWSELKTQVENSSNANNTTNPVIATFLGNLITYEINLNTSDAYLRKEFVLQKSNIKKIKLVNLKKLTDVSIKDTDLFQLGIYISYLDQNGNQITKDYSTANFTQQYEDVAQIEISIKNMEEHFVSNLSFEFFTREVEQTKENNVGRPLLIVFLVILIVLFVIGLIFLYKKRRDYKDNVRNSGVYEEKDIGFERLEKKNKKEEEYEENGEKMNSSMRSDLYYFNEDLKKRKEKELKNHFDQNNQEVESFEQTSEDHIITKSDELYREK